MNHWCKDESAPAELWKPFTQQLCKMAKQHANKGKNVAIGFALYRAEMRDYARTLIPDLMFVHVHVPVPVLLDRSLLRTEKIMSQNGLTVADCWALKEDMYNEARATYGEEYTPDRFKKWMEEKTYKGFQDFYPGEPNVATVDNTKCNEEGVENLNKVLGIQTKGKLDLDAIANVQYERMK